MNRLTRMQHRLWAAHKLLDDDAADTHPKVDYTPYAPSSTTGMHQAVQDNVQQHNAQQEDAAWKGSVKEVLTQATHYDTQKAECSCYQSEAASPAIDYDRIAEAASQRPLVVYVDKKAAAALLAREMDVEIGNRNVQQLVSMGG